MIPWTETVIVIIRKELWNKNFASPMLKFILKTKKRITYRESTLSSCRYRQATATHQTACKQKQRIVLLYTILCFLFHQSTVTIGLILVEMRGVEPLSENIAIQLSPSADVILCFALRLPDDGPSHCYPKEFPLKPIGISLKVSHN